MVVQVTLSADAWTRYDRAHRACQMSLTLTSLATEPRSTVIVWVPPRALAQRVLVAPSTAFFAGKPDFVEEAVTGRPCEMGTSAAVPEVAEAMSSPLPSSAAPAMSPSTRRRPAMICHLSGVDRLGVAECI